ncbi:hypothetical protein WR25_03006 [Diploscapter pachys]|uniref:Neurotransmitter-gated ion-channel transmembrane domain-containing protein n=1 Tax=Diploscapter pachys TaxID=2018661 RepID=A0A2A2KUT5_9BILA|nr:hypothetical protein WR25_03006 [Diploscapter pachys]
MQYAWRVVDGEEGIKLDHESVAELPQFSVIGYEILKPQNITRDRPYSALEARFYFRRHFSYYLMNFYVPCTLIVLLCERIGIGITNMLTLILISIDSKTDSPKVDLATALDVFIWICYLFNFLGMLEFTIVHYYTKFNTGDPEIQAKRIVFQATNRILGSGTGKIENHDQTNTEVCSTQARTS